ncbi:SGNH/GDSL hydrolase family protein [Saccharothrix syringae]|uniref:SGNH/GDSL hydrolase family protein n=1 Tax=Saccharothrix syringae TaxID=103733 RepID=A0A5Q0GZC1_SACSY|nr:SGNH/GDSL hydrolase family protein [Saccharothrix syringae]QFZ19377.1 SGNH/GDSL hydrolase family protein [Saccharothrix syringae]
MAGHAGKLALIAALVAATAAQPAASAQPAAGAQSATAAQPATGAQSATAAQPGAHARGWVAAWAASPVVGSAVPWNSCPAGEGLADQTVRNVVFTSAGGRFARVRLTNAFGTKPLKVGRTSVAVQAAGDAAVPGTLRAVTFGGRREVTVPVGREVFSDPVRLDVAALSTLLVSAYLPEATGPLTNHPFTAQGNYLAAGDRTGALSGGFADTPCWMVVDGVDVAPAGRVKGAVVAFGDSITDTASTTGNANRRWPDFLARRLDAVPGRTLSVVNAGLGGNRLIADRDEPYWGVAGVTRVQRDVLSQTGVEAVIMLLAVNDIGYSASAADLIAGHREVIRQARAAGVAVYGGTVLPFKGSFIWTGEREATWRELNDWIRTSGEFDGVVDFAAATAVPGDPATLDPAYDSGDHLHPNDAGTEAMANAVDLAMLLGRR